MRDFTNNYTETPWAFRGDWWIQSRGKVDWLGNSGMG
jgi:hypothetical protein